MRRASAIILAAGLLLTGCFKAEVSVNVADDGSGTVSVLSAVDVEAMGGFGSLGDLGDLGEDIGDLGDPCDSAVADASSGAPPGATVEPYSEGSFCGARITIEFAAGDDVNASIAEATAGLDSDGASIDVDNIDIRRDGDNWTFESDVSDNSAGGDLGGDDLDAGFDEFGAELLKDAEMTFRIKLPGRQVDHNADRIDSDGAMVWELDLLGEERDRLFARTEPGETITGSSGGGGSSTLLIVGAVVIAAALLGFVVWRMTRKPGATPTPAVAAPFGAAAPVEGAVGASPSAMPTSPPSVFDSPTPEGAVWDAELGAYVYDDPARGRLVHDSASGEWRPAPPST